MNIHRKRRYQPRDHGPRLLATKAKPGLKTKFKQAFAHARTLVPVKEIAPLVRHGRIAAAKDAVDWAHLRGVYREVFDEIGTTFEKGGALGAADITRRFHSGNRVARYGRHWPMLVGRSSRRRGGSLIVRKDIGDQFAFDRFDEATRARIRQYQDDLIRELETRAREAIDQAVMYGVTQDLGAESIAASIRDSISLTARQVQAVENYRVLLENGDPGALDRALRDASFDDMVENAVFGDAELSAETIDQMVDRYAENYLDYRANSIAETESTRAANLGLHDAYGQAADQGVFPEGAVRRFWLLALTERTCETCISVAEMNSEGVGIYEDFQSIDGPIDDPAVHPFCNCSVEYQVDLDQVPAEEEA